MYSPTQAVESSTQKIKEVQKTTVITVITVIPAKASGFKTFYLFYCDCYSQTTDTKQKKMSAPRGTPPNEYEGFWAFCFWQGVARHMGQIVEFWAFCFFYWFAHNPQYFW